MNEEADVLAAAWGRREEALSRWAAEETDTYRLLHGTAEGWAGTTVDRYGETILLQSFHSSLDEAAIAEIEAFYLCRLEGVVRVVYNDRSARNSRRRQAEVEEAEAGSSRELGGRYRTAFRHGGQDPLLFLDMRAGRRWLKTNAKGKTFLNLFAYTCGAGVAAAIGGAGEVWNVDFSRSYLNFGRENAELNGIEETSFRLIQSDCFPALWQLAGLPVKQRMRRLPNGRRVPRTMPEYPELPARQFDLTMLDPPRWAKSPFATVDLVRDYQSLFKPALLATREGGEMLVCNNVAKVERDAWLDALVRCGKKAGREVSVREVLAPEADFPSFDGNHPLKMAVIGV